MIDRMDLSKGVVPIVLVVSMMGAVGAGSWWASGISRDIQDLSDKLEPMGAAAASVQEHKRDIRDLQARVDKCEAAAEEVKEWWRIDSRNMFRELDQLRMYHGEKPRRTEP